MESKRQTERRREGEMTDAEREGKREKRQTQRENEGERKEKERERRSSRTVSLPPLLSSDELVTHLAVFFSWRQPGSLPAFSHNLTDWSISLLYGHG